MGKKIRKALIPAAGFGTRFLPQTKAMPKEMMPLVDKPIIQRVVEELVDAGIETVVIVTGWHKRSIEDHFDRQFELEQKLSTSGKEKELEAIKRISEMAEFIYIRQKGEQGNATPILNAQHVMNSEPFMVFWGDDFVDATPSRARQLIEAYEKYGGTILGATRPQNDAAFKKYGFVGGEKVDENVIKVTQVVEKPGSREAAPSDLAIISGFVLTPQIYEYLEKARKDLPEGEELVYTLGLQGMIDAGLPVHAVEIKNGKYRDTGNKLEYLKTVTEYGIDHEEFGEDFKKYLKKLVENS